jgi:hypothetical protein
MKLSDVWSRDHEASLERPRSVHWEDGRPATLEDYQEPPLGSNTKLRKGACRLALPEGKPHPDAVRSFMLDCLVPLLADEFLKRREATVPPAIPVEPKKPTSKPHGRRAVASDRQRP